MSVTERARHELHERLVELMGPTRAETLMEHLPPTGWGDVATKADLDHLEARIDHRFESLAQHIDALEERMQLRMDAQEHRMTAAWDARLRQNTLQMFGFIFTQTALLMTLILATR